VTVNMQDSSSLYWGWSLLLRVKSKSKKLK
jgi:hypothetical protein